MPESARVRGTKAERVEEVPARRQTQPAQCPPAAADSTGLRQCSTSAPPPRHRRRHCPRPASPRRSPRPSARPPPARAFSPGGTGPRLVEGEGAAEPLLLSATAGSIKQGGGGRGRARRPGGGGRRRGPSWAGCWGIQENPSPSKR
jgi:hypothetical protein